MAAGAIWVYVAFQDRSLLLFGHALLLFAGALGLWTDERRNCARFLAWYILLSIVLLGVPSILASFSQGLSSDLGRRLLKVCVGTYFVYELFRFAANEPADDDSTDLDLPFLD